MASIVGRKCCAVNRRKIPCRQSKSCGWSKYNGRREGADGASTTGGVEVRTEQVQRAAWRCGRSKYNGQGKSDRRGEYNGRREASDEVSTAYKVNITG